MKWTKHVTVKIIYKTVSLLCQTHIVQCVPKKSTTYFQTAVTPLRIVKMKKVGIDSERA